MRIFRVHEELVFAEAIFFRTNGPAMMICKDHYNLQRFVRVSWGYDIYILVRICKGRWGGISGLQQKIVQGVSLLHSSFLSKEAASATTR